MIMMMMTNSLTMTMLPRWGFRIKNAEHDL